MAIDPNMLHDGLGDFSPTDLGTGTKMGHHAHDHQSHKKDKDGDGIEDDKGIVDPWRHAARQAWNGLIRGATSLGLFGAVFMAVKYIVPAALGTIGTGIVAGALSGAVWYGGKAAIDAYKDANEHNQNFLKQVQDKVRFKSRMKEIGDELPQFGITTGAETPVVAIANENGEMAIAPMIAVADPRADNTSRLTPAYVAEILAKGPSKGNVAAEILADREAAELTTNGRA